MSSYNIRAILSFATLGIIATYTSLLLSPKIASADVPGIEASPLEYIDTLSPGHVKIGHIDVSNPGDSQVTILSSVQGFRQSGNDGRLEFFDDASLSNGIKVDLPSFALGPREAVRVGFTVDPSKLQNGGVYAAIFFRTLPPQQNTESSYVAQSANIGTLLELTNGTAGPHYGQVSNVNFNFWQFGNGLLGSIDYHNTDDTSTPLGFRPELTVRVFPWGSNPTLKTGLVLPGATRHFQVVRTGAFLGFLPILITDSATQRVDVRWVFAITGWYQWGLIVLFIVVFLIALRRIKNLFRPAPKVRPRRPMDGLSPKK
jgi:hypothetical protein